MRRPPVPAVERTPPGGGHEALRTARLPTLRLQEGTPNTRSNTYQIGCHATTVICGIIVALDSSEL